MEWRVFVWLVMEKVKEFKRVEKVNLEEGLEVKRGIRRMFSNMYLEVFWKSGKGWSMVGVCGNDWNWNWEVERLERFEERVKKEVRWF